CCTPDFSWCETSLLHVAGGLPYWASVVSTTIGLRVAVLPLVISGMVGMTRLELAKPEVEIIQAKFADAKKRV
ncbi:unnamed protein product, partial [Choristocarpus tenellus]